MNYYNTIQGLERYASDKKFLEELNNGLIVLEAYYSDLDTLHDIQHNAAYRPVEPRRDNMETYLACQAINVTNLLQIMVS